jgi:hypothetical protein
LLKLAPRCLRAAWSLCFLLAVCLLGLQFRCRYSDFGWSAHGVVLVDCCREEASIVLESPDQRLEGSWFELLSRGDFSTRSPVVR